MNFDMVNKATIFVVIPGLGEGLIFLLLMGVGSRPMETNVNGSINGTFVIRDFLNRLINC